MLKLKIINKPKMLKIKCNFKFPEVVLANLQEKEVIPTKEKQEVIADSNYDGLSKVIVDKIPNEYIIPQGQIGIIKNGIYDVTDKVNANVSVPEKSLGTKTITSNGTYKAIDDGLDGYSEVEVSTSGVDINEYFDLKQRVNVNFTAYIKQIPMIDTSQYTKMDSLFSGYSSLITIPKLNTSKVTIMNYMFSRCSSLISIPLIDTSNVKSMAGMFSECDSLLEIPQLDTSKVTYMGNMIRNCSKLVTIPQLDAGKVTNLSYDFYMLEALQNFGGLLNIGQAYLTTSSANHSNYKYDLSSCQKLTHDSLINVINGLYDIASAGVQPQQLVLGSANLAKLTSKEIAIIQNKGWNLS